VKVVILSDRGDVYHRIEFMDAESWKTPCGHWWFPNWPRYLAPRRFDVMTRRRADRFSRACKKCFQ